MRGRSPCLTNPCIDRPTKTPDDDSWDHLGSLLYLTGKRMADLSETDERSVRNYVNSQSPKDDEVTLVQQVGSRRILGHKHDLYDVNCAKSRWWVITKPTNLYLQSDFPEVEQALIFHLGLSAFLAERSRSTMEDADVEEHVSSSWRRFQQALDGMHEAEESEDYQAVGVKCRDALIALAKDHLDAEWIGHLDDAPKAADFKGWANIFAERLCESGRLRTYLKTIVDKTWDITVWLQHNSNATPVDADIVLEATGHLIGTLGRLIRRHELDEPDRCPRCDSYRVREDIENDATDEGFWESDICAACGWQSERIFTSWRDHFEGTDIEGYLASPGSGVGAGQQAAARLDDGQ